MILILWVLSVNNILFSTNSNTVLNVLKIAGAKAPIVPVLNMPPDRTVSAIRSLIMAFVKHRS